MATIAKNIMICKGARACGKAINVEDKDIKMDTGTCSNGVNQYTKYFICPNCSQRVIIKQGMTPGPRSMPSAGGRGR